LRVFLFRLWFSQFTSSCRAPGGPGQGSTRILSNTVGGRKTPFFFFFECEMVPFKGISSPRKCLRWLSPLKGPLLQETLRRHPLVRPKRDFPSSPPPKYRIGLSGSASPFNRNSRVLPTVPCDFKEGNGRSLLVLSKKSFPPFEFRFELDSHSKRMVFLFFPFFLGCSFQGPALFLPLHDVD